MKAPKQKFAYYFKVTLETGYEERQTQKPYREIVLLNTHTLSTLARVIVSAFGFYFDHCYGFYNNFKNPFDSKEMYELFTDIGEEPTEGALGVTHIKITKAFPLIGKKLRFLFDYGDNWWFTVEFINTKQSSASEKYPRILRKVGNAPEQYPEVDEELIN